MIREGVATKANTFQFLTTGDDVRDGMHSAGCMAVAFRALTANNETADFEMGMAAGAAQLIANYLGNEVAATLLDGIATALRNGSAVTVQPIN